MQTVVPFHVKSEVWKRHFAFVTIIHVTASERSYGGHLGYELDEKGTVIVFV